MTQHASKKMPARKRPRLAEESRRSSDSHLQSTSEVRFQAATPFIQPLKDACCVILGQNPHAIQVKDPATIHTNKILPGCSIIPKAHMKAVDQATGN